MKMFLRAKVELHSSQYVVWSPNSLIHNAARCFNYPLANPCMSFDFCQEKFRDLDCDKRSCERERKIDNSRNLH